MGLFTRRNARDGPDAPANATAATITHEPKTRHGPTPATLSMSSKPTFGQWLKGTWVDLATMLVMGMIGLGVYFAHPAASRSFPVYFQDGEIVYPQFAYPLRKEIVPIWAAALIGFFVPLAGFLICQFRVRSFWDLNNAVIGVLYSLITAAVFQVFLKWLIGGLRPHFLAVCNPDIPVYTSAETGNGLNMIMYDRTICTGDRDEIDDSLESFPSGHSTAAFAGLVFLSLYLNAKLKLFANHHPAMWKLIAVWAPVLGATLIAGALTIDEFHNWYDCLAGAVIGTFMAFSAYRMVFAAIWDWRINHIPLNRAVPFVAGEAELEGAVFTRRAGWGGAGSGHDVGHHGAGVGQGMGNGYENGVGASNGASLGRKPVPTHNGHHHNGSDAIV
ncbi:phosphatidic acid phosphatase type 2/haloperoxidase [Calycina marina]|uniref:Phosphatidic acid phosphatase type 2/haloperoxidase n=1 Tax=Calycina marina TaxID=1763456 RepID=A0A9P8CAY3_9HELO|nr:phosphatidic acid phosphatase type 2/haloperoxidase [Calycina marina]